jgi:NAD(P)H dehydrogenase (quinone)
MKKLAIIYHSGYGHTAHFAQHVLEGARSVSSVATELMTIDQASKSLDLLAGFNGIIFGSPTYMGGVSGPFKTFMDSTSSMWMKQTLKHKLAGGFTVSGSPSGDKLNSLMSMTIFAAQHGMIWVGNSILPETYSGAKPEEAANRLGSFLGAMAQASQEAPEKSFVPGDLKTATLFGKHFAEQVARIG